jgi:shikimate kinase
VNGVDCVLKKNNNKNIVLIGFMGTGKTVVGRAIANKINTEFVDVDLLIEKEAGMNISDIFSRKGEEYFRDIEGKVIKKVSYMKNVVIATGGGAVLRKENIDNLRDNGVIVLLRADVDTILNNISHNLNRPLLQSNDVKKTITQMLKKREEYYKNNDFEVDVSAKSVEQVAVDVLNVSNIKKY